MSVHSEFSFLAVAVGEASAGVGESTSSTGGGLFVRAQPPAHPPTHTRIRRTHADKHVCTIRVR